MHKGTDITNLTGSYSAFSIDFNLMDTLAEFTFVLVGLKIIFHKFSDRNAQFTSFLPCPDINECTAADQLCDTNANCTNTQGSFYCSCLTGFTGDGEHCKGKNKK